MVRRATGRGLEGIRGGCIFLGTSALGHPLVSIGFVGAGRNAVSAHFALRWGGVPLGPKDAELLAGDRRSDRIAGSSYTAGKCTRLHPTGHLVVGKVADSVLGRDHGDPSLPGARHLFRPARHRTENILFIGLAGIEFLTKMGPRYIERQYAVPA